MQKGLYRDLELLTSAGTVHARLYAPAGASLGVLALGEQLTGLAEALHGRGVLTLVLTYRDPLDPIQRGLDALVARHVLAQQPLAAIGTVALEEVEGAFHWDGADPAAVMAWLRTRPGT